MDFERRPVMTMITPGRPDRWLIILTLGLVLWGMVMVYSASITNAFMLKGSSFHYLIKHIEFTAAGILVMILMASRDYHRLAEKKFVIGVLLAVIVLLILVHVPPLGHRVNGAARWIRLGPFGFQPSELAKAAVVLFLAASIARKGEDRMRTFSLGIVPHLVVPGIIVILLMLQPDFGSSVIVLAMVAVMLFSGGARLAWLGGLTWSAVALGVIAVWKEPYRLTRILTFLNPWEDFRGAGYQTIQSLIAFGSGGLFGRGLGNGRQKLFYLPAIHTDFIFSNLGEEVGFIGVTATIIVFAVFIVRGMQIARRASDPFGRYLAWGVICLLGLEIVLNLGVVMVVLPTKGLALPFMSYGGSSVVVTFLLVGILLSVSRWADMEAMR